MTTTLAELQALPDAMLNRRVAEAEGYSVICHMPGCYILLLAGKPYLPGNTSRCRKTEVEAWAAAPNYCGDIAAAWALVEGMKDSLVMLTKHRLGFACTIFPFDSTEEDDDGVEVEDKHPARAIVLARLLALEGQP